jgi:hypothetical protein
MSTSSRPPRRPLRLRRRSEPSRRQRACLAEAYGLLCPFARHPVGQAAAQPASPPPWPRVGSAGPKEAC